MNEPLVLLPCMMGDARVFLPQVAALSCDHAVTVAPVGMGERVEEIASALLDVLPAKFALAGLSFGGIVALEMVRRAPERITRIALMDTTPLPESPQFAAGREARIVAARAGRLAEIIREELPASALAPGAGRGDVLSLLAEMALTLGPDVFVRQSRALQRRKDQQATLRRIRQPTLILCGEHDTLTPVRRHEFMADMVPFAKLEIINDAGHLPPLEQPQAVINALRRWMRQPLVLR